VTEKGFAYIVERGGGDEAMAGNIKNSVLLLISFHAPEYEDDKEYIVNIGRCTEVAYPVGVPDEAPELVVHVSLVAPHSSAGPSCIRYSI
jgi:hypothetical protein